MSQIYVATDCVTGSTRSLSSSSFGPWQTQNPFHVVSHQSPIVYSLSYYNSQTPFDDYRFNKEIA